MLTIGTTIKAKYDGEWYTGQLVAYNDKTTSGQLILQMTITDCNIS